MSGADQHETPESAMQRLGIKPSDFQCIAKMQQPVVFAAAPNVETPEAEEVEALLIEAEATIQQVIELATNRGESGRSSMPILIEDAAVLVGLATGGIAALRAGYREADPARDAELRADGQAEAANAFVEWAMKNEIAEPPLDWAWFGEIARRYSPLHEEHDR